MPEPPAHPHEDPFLIPPTEQERQEWEDACRAQGCSDEYIDAANDFWDGVGDFFQGIWDAIVDFFEWLWDAITGRSG